MPKKKEEKVLVAMSGGVDSSVAAALLLKQGYDVSGAFMINYQAPSNGLRPTSSGEEFTGRSEAETCWHTDYRDATRVAAKLGIQLLKLDFKKDYEKKVMEYMYAEYKKGRTPNPDVLCNKFIKFGVWLEKAKELGFDKLATGHYARLRREIRNKFEYHLMEAKDKDKDQTYFLHQLGQEQLKDVLFPIGDYKKPEVRKLARKFDLPTAEREESMGICFVGEVPMKEFLSQKISPQKGKIVNSAGDVLGEHDGLAFYTIGQRHFGMQNLDNKPLYIVGKNIEKNELIVGYENDPMLYKKEIEVKNVNWIVGPVSVHRAEFTRRKDGPGKLLANREKDKNKFVIETVSGQILKFPLKCKVRLRHRQKMQNAECGIQDNKLIVEFDKPQKAVTPGQFAVFYLKGECLGGGEII